MKLTTPCTNIYTYFRNDSGSVQNYLFFDIETTGLSARYSHLYLIGAALCNEQGQLETHQWFANRPTEERELLLEFSEFVNAYSGVLVHFNGTTFDLPYLIKKYTQYELEIPDILMSAKQIDLYREAKALSALLQLSSYKQKSVEQFLGIFREDPYTGGELIEFYQHYLQTADASLRDALLLHNREDIEALPALLSLSAYCALIDECTTCLNYDWEISGSELVFSIRGSSMVPRKVDLESRFESHGQEQVLALEMNRDRMILHLPFVEAELKHYYPDFKNYFYLPKEDKAIHKSVGQYVDREFRIPAKADTCYQMQVDSFVPLLTDTAPGGKSGNKLRKEATEKFASILFCENRTDRMQWIRLEQFTSMLRERADAMSTDPMSPSEISLLLRTLLSNFIPKLLSEK